MTADYKAIALISGGLDSMLAVKVLQRQGIYVEGINFYTGFCIEGHTQAIRSSDKKKPKRNNALWVAEQLGIKLHIVDIIEPYKEIVINPKYGYGANLNPCLDCKVFMVKTALEWMHNHGFDFIITGEVVGQRPMSQRKDTLNLVANKSGASDLILRPLSAKNLRPSRPEIDEWVDRSKLLAFNGRSRKPQIALAKQFGISDYAQPAGGCCFLTDESYSARLLDFWQSRDSKTYELDDILLLKVGRQLRPKPHFKLVIARDEGEGNFLHGYRHQYTHVYSTSHNGPLTLVMGVVDDTDLALAAQITARFGQGRDSDSVTVEIIEKDKAVRSLAVTPLTNDELLTQWYI